MPFSHVNQVIEDSRNYLWVASDRGLFRFDGTRFEDFNTNLKSRNINGLAQWNDSTWLFSNDLGIFSFAYNGDSVSILPFRNDSESVEEFEYPRNLFVDSRKRLWIAQLNGTVILMAGGESSLLAIAPDAKTEKIYFGEDSKGTVWALIPGTGLFYFDENKLNFQRLPIPMVPDHFRVEGDTLLLAGNGLEQWTIAPNHQLTNRDVVLKDGLSFNFIARDRAGTLFLVTADGLYSYQKGAEEPLKPVFGSNDPHRVEELPYNEVNHLYFSTSQIRPGGALWVSTPNGLGLLFSSYFKSVSGLSHDNVFALGHGEGGEVLISQGNVYSVRTSETGDLYHAIPGLNRITSISATDGNTWYGSADGMLIKAGPFGQSMLTDLSGRGGGIFYTYADSQGELWFCQAPSENPILGIGKIKRDGSIQYYGQQQGLTNRILVAHEGGKSELYVAGIGSDTYLFKYDREADHFVNQSQVLPFPVSRNFEVHDISVGKDGMVWMGSTDGLLKYDTERVYRVELGEFTDQEIRAVCSLADGSLWVATDTRGLLHLQPDGSYVHFDEKSGTPSKIASYRCLLLDAQEHLWVGTAEGVVYSALQSPGPLDTASPVLKGIRVNNKARDKNEKLEAHRDDRILLDFTSLAFPGADCQYQFKVFPVETESSETSSFPWSQPRTGGEISLPRLEGGSHILLVRAKQPGGYAWSPPAEVPVWIRKPWYATWWGLGLLILSAVLFFWFVVRIWVLRKVGRLEATIFKAEKELLQKETQLKTTERALKSQRKELKSIGINTYLLHRLLRQIPEKADWHNTLPYLEKLVQMPTGIDAFSLAFLKKDRVCHLGFNRLGKDLFKRETEFSEKDNLTSYVLAGKKTLLIGNYNLEAAQYINIPEDTEYLSRMYIPFLYSGKSEAVFCAYASLPDVFDQNNLIEIQILVLFLSRNINGQLKDVV